MTQAWPWASLTSITAQRLMLNEHPRNSAKGLATHEIAAQWLTTLTANWLILGECQPCGLSLLLMNYSQVAYHVHRRHAKQLRTSITGMSAAWLILITYEL